MPNKNRIENRRNQYDFNFKYTIKYIPEMKVYISGYNDFEDQYATEYITEDRYRRMMDVMFKRKNGMFINFEHQHKYTTDEKLKNLEYKINQSRMTKTNVKQTIFYTGNNIHVDGIYTDNEDIFVNNDMFITKRKECEEHLNSIEYKNSINKTLNGFDAVDLTWAHTYRHDESDKDIIYQCATLAKDMKAPKYLAVPITNTIHSWSMHFFEGKSELDEIEEMLNMNYALPIEEIQAMDILNQRIKHERIMAEKKIKEQKNTIITQGNRIEQMKMEYNQERKAFNQKEMEYNQERTEFIKLLLKTYTPIEISQKMNIPVSKIKTIQRNMD